MAGESPLFTHFSFYKLDIRWRRLPPELKAKGKEEARLVLEKFAGRFAIHPYSLTGIRGDVDFLLWKISDRIEDFQEFATAFLNTSLGGYLETPYAYLAMTRRSKYVGGHEHEGGHGATAKLEPEGRPYLMIYPFTKTHEWYQLPFEERKRMMGEHFRIGHKYPNVKIHTTYSYGLDDQEFVLAFETDRPEDFLNLVEDLRFAEARKYTLRDTPIFACVAVPDFRALLNEFG
ncbi:MAG: chlorite dismutase family protein [Euryarchaeota archaeon]|nr:chlorite dismutase family protein [Euryarchaeota archaeon]